MLNITLNGRPLDESSIEDIFLQAVIDAARERFGTIRHPETGEFPVLHFTGGLEDLQMHVEASPELLAVMEQKLSEDTDSASLSVEEMNQPPRVFLSYSSSDRDLASRLAHVLQENGIDTWWDQWCIGAGDSIRQKIESGLADCTHFVVLLTEASLKSSWVRREMDAGLVKELSGRCKLIPLRCGIGIDRVPALLQPLHCPEIDVGLASTSQLVNDIYGVARKPALGEPPKHVQLSSPGVSAAASAVAKFFVEASEHGLSHEPIVDAADLATKLQLTAEDLDDAIHELSGKVEALPFSGVYPKPSLFAEFDGKWMPWSPAADAVALAAHLVNAGHTEPTDVKGIAKVLGWQPRRLNPAMAYLERRRLVSTYGALGTAPWLFLAIAANAETRRFVRGRR